MFSVQPPVDGVVLDVRAVVPAALAALLSRVRELADQVANAPEVEPVHDLRVGLRRLHAALRIIRPVCEPPRIRVGSLRRVEASLGKVRDEDIVLAWLGEESLAELGLPLDAHLERLRRGAERRRRRAAARVARVLEGKKFHRTLDDTDDWLASPRLAAVAAAPASAVAPDLVAPLLSRVALHRAWHLSWPPGFKPETNRVLHQLRRRLKRLRYAVEFLDPAWDGRAADLVGEWHAVLDGLGAWHDVALTAERLSRGTGNPAATEALARRGALALMDWPRWRASWTDPAHIARARGILLGAERGAQAF